MQAARGASLTSDETTRSRLPLLAAVASGAWVIDQVTKWWAHSQLAGRDSIEVLGPLLQLTYARNPGAAFSAGAELTVVISLFAIVATVVACRYALKVRTAGWAWAIGLVLAGITGNLADRIFRDPGPLRGHVVDFLELPNWPIFNVADICINAGAVLIVVLVFRGIHVDGTREPKDAA